MHATKTGGKDTFMWTSEQCAGFSHGRCWYQILPEASDSHPQRAPFGQQTTNRMLFFILFYYFFPQTKDLAGQETDSRQTLPTPSLENNSTKAVEEGL